MKLENTDRSQPSGLSYSYSVTVNPTNLFNLCHNSSNVYDQQTLSNFSYLFIDQENLKDMAHFLDISKICIPHTHTQS